MQSVKQGGIKYHFLSLWYDSTWDWTLVSETIGAHSTPSFDAGIYIYIYIYICEVEEVNFLYLKRIRIDLKDRSSYINIYIERERIVIAATVSLGMPYASRICSIFPLWMESKALVKSTNINVACRFFARTPSRILRMVNICEVVDLFLRKPFWFFLSNGFELTKKRSRRYPATTITDADYADDIAILANTPDQAETLLHSLERAAASIGLYVNAHKTEYMCYNQTGDISTLEGTPLKLVDKFTYLGSSVESTEKDIETRLTKAWTATNRLSIIWKSDLTDKMKRISSRQRSHRYCYMDALHGR